MLMSIAGVFCMSVCVVTPAIAREPGTISVEGGVDQNPDELDHPGYRCDPKTPMRFSIEGPSLIYVELSPKVKPADTLFTFLPEKGGEKPITITPLEQKKKDKPVAFAMSLERGLHRFHLRCHRPQAILLRMWSVESVPKKLPQLAIPPR